MTNQYQKIDKTIIHYFVILWTFTSFSVKCLGATSKSKELSLNQVVSLTLSKHPRTKAEQLKEESIQKNIDIARSLYYPRVNAMALITNGFPGSAGATGVGGLMVSPFHKGPAAGVLVEQEIWNFGRTSGNISVAEKESELAKSESSVTSLEIAQNAIQSFFNCARDKSLLSDYERIQRETEKIAKEVDSFVNKGQRSIVDRYLSKSQAEEAFTLTKTYRKRLELDKKELELLTGMEKNENIECAALSSKMIAMSSKSDTVNNPYLDQANKRIEVSRARMELAKKDYLPRVVGVGSFGYLQDTEFNVPIKIYSLAAGLIFPLFEGFKTKSEVAKERIRVAQHEQEEAAVQEDVQQANLRYDRLIESSRVQIASLTSELKLAEKAYSLAKTRYYNTQGTLIDLREAVRNLARTHTQLKEAQATFLSKTAEKNAFNGGFNLENENK